MVVSSLNLFFKRGIELRVPKMELNAAKIACALVLFVCLNAVAIDGQENANGNIAPSLYECYNGTVDRWNLLPHDMVTLIAILRKIEESPGAGNMDLRVFTTAILHRFRQDAIVRSEEVVLQPGILPYAPNGPQFYRHRKNLQLIPGSAVNFPNDSISALERCTLHSMLSSTIDTRERGDESRTCKSDNYRSYNRRRRSVDKSENLDDEVEIIPQEQRDMLQKMEDNTDGAEDPSALYPAVPDKMRAQRQSALSSSQPRSRCPIEQGVVKTRWGTVTGGSIIAGIAAGLAQQSTRLAELMKNQNQDSFTWSQKDAVIDNKFLGTLSGDLAEVAITQGPKRPMNARFTVGIRGAWNSSVEPRYYFLGSSEDLEMTEAEIRGDLDGLVMGSYIQNNSRTHERLKLSQVLDMYYSDRGLFEKQYRACNRRVQRAAVASTEQLVKQTYAAAILLSKGMTSATITNYDKYEEYARQAVKDFSDYLPQMNHDSSCEGSSFSNEKPIDEPAVDLKIILDTTWPFHDIEPVIYQLLKSLDISKFNSNFTIINGQNGEVIVNSTHHITDYQYFNATVYERQPKGLELFRALESLRRIQTSQLNHEKRAGIGGGKSDVVLILPYQTSVSDSDKQLCWEALKVMREQVPDATVLFLTHGSKDRWRDLVLDFDSDVVAISVIGGEAAQSYPAIDTLQERIKRVPRRMINSQCGATYEREGRSASITEYVGPNGINFYRIHPNYFHSDDTASPPTVKIQGTGVDSLRICTSRELLHVNATDALMRAECKSITTNAHSFTMNCEGAYYLHECKPYYLAVSANASVTSSFSCNDPKVCRYPNNIRYTISYENLVCKSGASSLLATPLVLLLLLFALTGFSKA